MLERYIQDVRTFDAGEEPAAATRDRLKPRFPAGAARRMTLLGMMVGAMVADLIAPEDETIVYSSTFGETLALADFLDSFPAPGPTAFQTSIHPSGAQQGFIQRQRAVRELLPLAGGAQLAVQAALTAMLAPAARVLWCGGEERGSWLREAGIASDRSFAFAGVMTRERLPQAIGRIGLKQTGEAGALDLPAWFDLLHTRQSWRGRAGGGWELQLEWL